MTKQRASVIAVLAWAAVVGCTASSDPWSDAVRSMAHPEHPMPASPLNNPLMFNAMVPTPWAVMAMAQRFAELQQQQASRLAPLPYAHHHPMMAGRPAAPPTDAQANAQTEAGTSTLLGSLSSAGSRAMGAAHSLFVPPYSWMWRVGMTAASLEYKDVGKLADVPELMNLITGYYAGAPDALDAAKAAEKPSDRFSLNNLPYLFGGSPATKAAQAAAAAQRGAVPSAVGASPFATAGSHGGYGGYGAKSGYGGYGYGSHAAGSQHLYQSGAGRAHEDKGFMSSMMDALVGGGDDSSSDFMNAKAHSRSHFYDDDDDDEDAFAKSWKKGRNYDMADDDEDNSGSSSVMGSLLKSLGGSDAPSPAHNRHTHSRHASPGASGGGGADMLGNLLKLGAGGGGGGGSAGNPTAQMLQMAAPMLGVDPKMASMAAPLVSALL